MKCSMTSNPITAEEIIAIHHVFEKRFNLPQGHVKKGELEALVAKCEGKPFSADSMGVLEQAAILFEGITRLHMFTDGNKRTALETTRLFLNRNEYVLVVPLSGTNFIYTVAQDCTQDTEEIVTRIIEWLRNHSARTNQPNRIRWLLLVHLKLPVVTVRFFAKIRLWRCSKWIIRRYLMSRDSQVTEFILEIYEKQFAHQADNK